MPTLIRKNNAKPGRLITLEHQSHVLRDNPLTDPYRRTLHVYLPSEYDKKRQQKAQFPVLFSLAGFTGSGLSASNWKSFEENNNIPKLINLKDKIGFYDLEKIIKEGKGSMTGFPKISQIEIRVLAAYLLDEDSIKLSSNELKKIDHKLSPYGLDSFGRFLDENGYPAVKPPWGTLNAIDLNKGEIIWQVPLGEFKELTEKGFPITGTENYGGPIVTKGDLLFIGATKDQKFRAFNKFSGEKVWEKNLPAGGYATPITYQIDGKQFVVIASGGGKMGTPSGDYYVAFSLKK